MNWKQLKAISAAGALSMAMLATGVAQNTPAGRKPRRQPRPAPMRLSRVKPTASTCAW